MNANSTLLRAVLVLVVINGISTKETGQCFSASNTKSWRIDSGSGISYFYLAKRNAFMIYNEKIDYTLIFFSHSQTIALFNVKSGFGGVINLDPVQGYYTGYVPIDDMRGFDMSQVKYNNCKNLTALYEYGAQFIPYVTRENATNPNLGNITMMLEDIGRSTDVTTYPSYGGNQKLIKLVQDHFMDFITLFHEIYARGNITLPDCMYTYALIVADDYHCLDARSKFLVQFPSYIIDELKGEIYEEMISEFYRLITTKDDLDVIKQEFGKMKEAVRQVGSIYKSVPDAVKNYNSRN